MTTQTITIYSLSLEKTEQTYAVFENIFLTRNCTRCCKGNAVRIAYGDRAWMKTNVICYNLNEINNMVLKVK